MSESSFHTSSHEATNSENGVSAPADESPAGESPEPEAAQSGPGEDEAETRPDTSQIRDTVIKAETTSRPSSRKRQRQASGQKSGLKTGLHAYRDLLNEVIEDAAGRSETVLEPLPPSQIGASYWTSFEKDAFFRMLAVGDVGDLCALSQAVGTKSEAECHAYLRLLQDGVLEANVTLPAKDGFSMTAVPAAVEVSEDCEVALNDAAETLSRRVEKRDEDIERQRYGQSWLIDKELASAIEEEIESGTKPNESADESQDDDGNVPEAPETTLNKRPTDSHNGATGSILSDLPSARLLRPAALLQLSEQLFMNGPPNTDRNWQDIVASDSVQAGPAIYHTAFDDFYNLTVSLTRRLVQASLFQAMSRLRASDAARSDWQPKADVTSTDVRTAVDVLGMKVDYMTYWASAARRCRVEVYSDSEKYKDGRTTTKNGVKLTYDEVESELGLQVPREAIASDNDQAVVHGERDEADSEDFEVDSDAFTIESYTGGSSSGTDVVEEDDRSDEDVRPSKKRKRALSPRSQERAEDEYLESLDHQASVDEERRLWAVLGHALPAKAHEEAEVPRYKSSTSVRKSDEVPGSWRAGLKYEAEWEQFPEGVKVSEFDRMKMKDRERRMRRHTVQRKLRAGLEAPRSANDHAAEGQQDEDEASQDENVVDSELNDKMDDSMG